jgi:hypothetical protein
LYKYLNGYCIFRCQYLFCASCNGSVKPRPVALLAEITRVIASATGAQIAGALAVAGFVAGTVYWTIASYTVPRR